jgi:predicted ABC-type ATPase
MGDDQPLLILVAGVEGCGKTTFIGCFKNAFLQSLPQYPLFQGILGHLSFASESPLTESETLELLRKAKTMGYKLTIYYIFSGKLLSLSRSRYRALVNGHPFDETEFRKSYDKSYKNLAECFDLADLIFFVRNQKNFEFLSAFEPKNTRRDDFYEALLKVKNSVDAIK